MMTAALEQEYGAVLGPGAEPTQRSDGDDMPAEPGLDHTGNERYHAVDDTAEVDADDPVVILVGGGFGRAEGIDTRRLQKKLGRCAINALYLVSRGNIRLAVGNVQKDGVDFCVFTLKVRHCLVQVILTHVCDNDLTARLRKNLRHTEAGPGSSACDKCDLAFEICHLPVSLYVFYCHYNNADRPSSQS